MDANDETLLALHHVDHRFLGCRVIDTRSLREGVLQAVTVERGKRIAYVLGDDHREFDTPIGCVRSVQ